MIEKGWVAVLFLLALSACGSGGSTVVADTKPGKPQKNQEFATLVIVSANLHVGAGIRNVPENGLPEAEIRAALGKAAKIIKNAGADVVLLQEVDYNSRRTAFVNQGALMAELLGMHLSEAVTFDTWGSKAVLPHVLRQCRYGIATLTRRKPLAAKVVVLPSSPASPNQSNEGRAFLAVSIPLGERDGIFIGNTHLDFQSRAVRKAELSIIRKALPQEGWIIGGDFNEAVNDLDPSNAQVAKLIRLHDWPLPGTEKTPALLKFLGFSSIPGYRPLPTYPADNPAVAIDHIFADGRARVTKIERLDSQGASDHHFVKAVVKVKLNEKNRGKAIEENR